MKLVRSAIIALALTASPALAQKQPDTFDEIQSGPIDAALRAIQSGQPAQALDTLKPVLNAYQARHAAEKRKIYCGITPAQTIAYMAEAAGQNKSAIAISKGWCQALYLSGFALVDVGRPSDAELVFVRLVEMAPMNARFISELANTRRVQRKFDAALEGYRKAAAVAGLASDGREKIERGTAWRSIGWILVEQGKLDEAEKMYRKCLEIDPDDQKAKGELEYIANERKKAV